MNKYSKRRFALLVCMTLLAALAGFLWGQRYGYRQGKADTMKAIERGFNTAKQPDLPV